MKRLAFILPILLMACSDPITVVKAVDDRSRLKVEGAPPGAMLLIDGKSMGSAADYAGDPGVLLVDPGTHVVEIKAGDRLLLSQKVFFGGGEQRSIVVPPVVTK